MIYSTIYQPQVAIWYLIVGALAGVLLIIENILLSRLAPTRKIIITISDISLMIIVCAAILWVSWTQDSGIVRLYTLVTPSVSASLVIGAYLYLRSRLRSKLKK